MFDELSISRSSRPSNHLRMAALAIRFNPKKLVITQRLKPMTAWTSLKVRCFTGLKPKLWTTQ